MKNNNIKVSIILGGMCFLLTIGIFMQIKTVNNSGTKVAKTITENELRDNVLMMKEKYDKQYKILENKEKELSTLISNAASNDSTTSELSEKLEVLNAKSGLTALQGEGIKITLRDGVPSASVTTKESVIHDNDLALIVNDLCNAGAEAISINGQRIISTTGIACIGNVIKINNEKVGTPFEICAIGSAKGLRGAVEMNGRCLSEMKEKGIRIEIEEQNSITIPKYMGVLKYEYVR